MQGVGETMTRKNDIEKFFYFLRESKGLLYIYGTGEAGRIIWDCVANCLHISIKCFIDREAGTECCGAPVVDLSSVSSEVYVIVAANPEYKIQNRLIKAGIKHWIYIDPVFLNFNCHRNDYIASNRQLLHESERKIQETQRIYRGM